MSDKKNIDKLFQEKFKDFEVTPGDSVWNNISTELRNTGRGKKGIPIWWQVAGIAAGLLLLFTFSQLVLNNNNTTTPGQNTIVNIDSTSNDLQDVFNKENTIAEEKNISEDPESNSSKLISNSPITNTDTNSPKNYNSTNESKNKSVTVNTNPRNNNRNASKIDKKELVTSSDYTKNAVVDNSNSNLPQDKVQNNSIDKVKTDAILNPVNSATEKTTATGNIETNLANINNADDENIIEAQEPNDVIDEEEKISLTQEIAANEDEDNENTDEEEFERWKAASNIAPVYFNAFGKGSSIHPQFNNNSKTGNINMSYGITASYAINKKLSIRTGVSKVNLGYSTNDVIVYNNIDGSNDGALLRNVKLNVASQNLSFISIEEFNFAQVPSVLSNNIDGSIDQKLGFIEVPIELEYKISDKKMGINVIGGFSALFLNNNEVYSVFDGNTTLLGEATNINNTSFSANFGLGFDFKISNSFNLNLEPVFKYQLNTFNDTSGNFKPFFIGVYSGLSFKF